MAGAIDGRNNPRILVDGVRGVFLLLVAERGALEQEVYLQFRVHHRRLPFQVRLGETHLHEGAGNVDGRFVVGGRVRLPITPEARIADIRLEGGGKRGELCGGNEILLFSQGHERLLAGREGPLVVDREGLGSRPFLPGKRLHTDFRGKSLFQAGEAAQLESRDQEHGIPGLRFEFPAAEQPRNADVGIRLEIGLEFGNAEVELSGRGDLHVGELVERPLVREEGFGFLRVVQLDFHPLVPVRIRRDLEFAFLAGQEHQPGGQFLRSGQGCISPRKVLFVELDIGHIVLAVAQGIILGDDLEDGLFADAADIHRTGNREYAGQGGRSLLLSGDGCHFPILLSRLVPGHLDIDAEHGPQSGLVREIFDDSRGKALSQVGQYMNDTHGL